MRFKIEVVVDDNWFNLTSQRKPTKEERRKDLDDEVLNFLKELSGNDFVVVSVHTKDLTQMLPPTFTPPPPSPEGHNICEHDRQSLGEVPSSDSVCNHPEQIDLATAKKTQMPCHQQNCPWKERQYDDKWWENHPGRMKS